jgi:hypothetical protein
LIVGGNPSIVNYAPDGIGNIGSSGGRFNSIFAANSVVGGILSATSNVAGGNILTDGLISAGSTVTGTSHIGSVVSVTGNITGGNILTGGLVSATGNVTGGNILTGGLISATGNITGGNISTGGLLSATGNTTVGNIALTGSYTEGVVVIGTVVGNSTISLSSGTVQTATLTASTACTFTMPTATAGKSFMLFLKQAASGGGTATFSGVKWNATGTPTVTSTPGSMDIFSFTSDGTNWYGTASQGYTP